MKNYLLLFMTKYEVWRREEVQIVDRNKRLAVYAIVLLCAVSLISGCHMEKKRVNNKSEQTEAELYGEDIDQNTSSSEQYQLYKETEKKEEHVNELRGVTVYFVDNANGQVIGESFDIQDEWEIWTILQNKGVLTADCKLLNLSVNECEKKMNLDFNKATGDRIRNMGTTGETEIIGCIINTYLEAYGCDKIRITEEGKDFQTSHGVVFHDYTGRINVEE